MPSNAQPAFSLTEDQIATKKELEESQKKWATSSEKMALLENRLSALSEKLTQSQTTIEKLQLELRAKTQGVSSHPSEGFGNPVEVGTGSRSKKPGFENTVSLSDFKKATLLFTSEKYSEALLEFLAFIEKHPDHPLTGSAQFHVGESYFQQGEFKLALPEFQKVLSHYGRSYQVAAALSRMSDCEEFLKFTESAKKHRILLTSVFPLAPTLGKRKPPVTLPIQAPETTNLRPEANPSSAPSPRPSPSEEPAIPTAPLRMVTPPSSVPSPKSDSSPAPTESPSSSSHTGPADIRFALPQEDDA